MKRIPELSSLLLLSLATACSELNPASDVCGPLGCADDGGSSGTAGVSQDDGSESRGGTGGPGGEGPGDATDGGASAGSTSAGMTDGGSVPGSGTDGGATAGDATDGATTEGDATAGETDAPAACGDGAVDEGEACDDGESNGSYGQCNAECSGLGTHCGDGEVQAEEQCDDGNEVWDDGCDPDCVRSGAVDVESGNSHNCVILRSREVKCWGYGSSGRLGYGNVDDIGDDETPASVGTLPLGGPVSQLALGGEHTCALLMDGSVKCWGFGGSGRLGYGNTESVGDQEDELALQGFVSVDDRRAVVQLAAGSNHTCAVLEGGAVKCWGSHRYGQLGLGLGLGNATSTATTVPSALDDVASGIATVQAGYLHTCTRAGSGVVRCWGSNSNGQLGNGASGTDVNSSPNGAIGAINGQGSLVAEVLATGSYHTCAARGTSAWCWGSATSGQLGRGSREPSSTPVAVAALSGATSPIDQLVARGYHTCTRHHNGELRCWGFNLSGQLGNGQSGSSADIGDGDGERALPIAVHPDPRVTVLDVSAGGGHTCALLSTGAVRCWGSNSDGQLGTGAGTSHNPGPPADLADIALFAEP